MASDPLENIWKSIIPLSSLPKTRENTLLNASKTLLPALTAANPAAGITTTRRMQQELTQHRIEKLTERVDSIIEAVNQAKSALMQTDGKLNSLMDKTMESNITLVNRAQTRVLEAIGQPVQQDIIKDLLESQKNTLDIVSLMFQQTTSLQATQANLQASLISLISQSQQLSVQMSSMEQRLTQKSDGLKEDTVQILERDRKRSRQVDSGPEMKTPESKRRKIERLEWETSLRQPFARDSIPLKPGTYSTNVPDPSPLCFNRTSNESSPDSPLTPLESQGPQPTCNDTEQLRKNVGQTRSAVSTENRVISRLTKAQKLASFLGDDSGEDGSMEDLFSDLR